MQRGKIKQLAQLFCIKHGTMNQNAKASNFVEQFQNQNFHIMLSGYLISMSVDKQCYLQCSDLFGRSSWSTSCMFLLITASIIEWQHRKPAADKFSKQSTVAFIFRIKGQFGIYIKKGGTPLFLNNSLIRLIWFISQNPQAGS